MFMVALTIKLTAGDSGSESGETPRRQGETESFSWWGFICLPLYQLVIPFWARLR
ncbi:hypothetical protein Pint_09954 [Pistacia integerrima]|uniref:Uncharacterized protein n=1 Tax=Pistacia integerrima TaxID=434235 RepID=A0ACC0XHY1_9ROSI|nr:hypothetical protein Pint_09954 [Pistacia integerrima]